MPRIEAVDAFLVAMPQRRRPRSLLVRLTDSGGTVGWGEVLHADTDSAAEDATEDSVWGDVRERIGPALLGLEWERPEDLAGLRQLGSCKAAAAVDIASWDLWCRTRGTPVAHALGGTRTSVVTGARLSPEAGLDALVTRVNRYVGSQFARITLEVRPGWDVEPVRAVRRAFPALALQIDASGRYDPASRDHLNALEALDSYGLTVIERPFPQGDLVAHSALQRQLQTAIAPEIGDLEDLSAAIAGEAGRALSLRVGRFGGLTAARAAHDTAFAAGWDVWCSGPGPFGIGQAAAVAVASLPGCTLPSDVSEIAGGPRFVSPPVRSSGGVVAVPLTQPGLGHEVDERQIARLASQAVRIPA
jgi:O-succinylbenzoate synthase